MTIIDNLEPLLTDLAEANNWRVVMHYEHGRLTGISMGTTSYIEDSTGILWDVKSTKRETPRLRIVRDETCES